MRTWMWSVALVLWAGPVVAEEPRAGKLVQDLWEVAHLEGARAGYFRTTVHEVERDDRKLYRTTQELNLTVKRQGQTAQLRAEMGTEEGADGKVVGVSMKMHQPGGPLVLTGTLKDGAMHVDIGGGRIRRQLPWDDKVLGLYAQERLFHKNKAKAGDKFTYRSFEPTINAVVTVRAAVHPEEEVDVLGARKKLLRATVASDKLAFDGGSIQLPAMTVWLDKAGAPVKRQFEIPGIGLVAAARTTREKARAPVEVARLPDLILKTLIPLDRRVPDAHATDAAVYRVTIDDESPETALARDDRQQVKNVDGKTFDLHVRARRSPEDGKDGKAGEEFLASCLYLDSDDERVRALAKQAVGDEADAWAKARRVARWVQAKMTTDNSVAFAPAGQVARQLRGDCRQHAMLAAAMCRAAGVPSRTAIGLVYVEDRADRPLFGFHMWLEVFVKGQWLALDPIFGPDGIGAAHIKVTDSSWHKVQDWRPLLPVSRVLGKMKVKVLRAGERP